MIRIRRMSNRHFKHICETLDESDKVHQKEMEALRNEIVQIKVAYVKKHGAPHHRPTTGIKGIAPDTEPRE